MQRRSSAPVSATPQVSERNSHRIGSPSAAEVLDWDEEELRAVLAHNLHYTIRSSKFPRTIHDPRRITLILNKKHTWSVHSLLLSKFSTHLSALMKNPNLPSIHINATTPIASPPAWRIFLTWLYTLDKIPLPDFTPIRRESWRSSHIRDACLLAAFLGAWVFEKYLLRVVCKELSDGAFPRRYVADLAERMPVSTGMHHFANAYFRWKAAGLPAELDPYRWRVEHWYALCGRGGNWGCFHGMGARGWRGVWERQGGLKGKLGCLVDVRREGENWMEVVLWDGVDALNKDGEFDCEGYEELGDGDAEASGWENGIV